MNFIAHLFLSGRVEPLLVGNFIADGVKGNKWQTYPEAIQKGIALHRFIDDFTDHHPCVKASKSFFVQEFKHYSGIVVDILYDHILTKNWSIYSAYSLSEFSAFSLQHLGKNIQYLQEHDKRLLEYITIYDRIYNYNQINTMYIVYRQMEKRLDKNVPFSKAVGIIEKNYTILERQFQEFFPLIKEASIQKIGALIPGKNLIF